MVEFFTSSASFQLFGIIGVAFVVIGSLVTAITYRGK